MSRVRLLQLAALATVFSAVALPRVASAQISSWQIIETAPGEPTEKQKNPPPIIKVKVVGEPAPKDEEKGKFKLEDTDQKKKMKGVAPIAVIPFHKSSDSLAIVVLVEGHQYYFGNDKYTQAPAPANPDAPPDPNAVRIITKVSKGVYDVIVNALDAPAGKDDETPTTISSAGNPSGSKGALIVYSVGADVRYPMGPLKDLTGEKLGPQELQKGKTSRELAEGLRESLTQLKKASATRRVLFVIADGFYAGSVEDIKAIRKQFDNEKIDIFAFHLEAGSDFIAGDDPQKNASVMKALGQGGEGDYFKIKDAADLTTKLTSAVTSINSRFYLVFPGQLMDAKTKLKSGFDWDGKEHELVLLKDEEAHEKTQSVVLMPVWGQSKGGSLWWLWIAIPGGLVVLIGLVALLTRKKAQPAPMPMPMPMHAPGPPQPAAAPPPQIQAAPAQANKTMAINISSGDGVPVVGWIVPISGPQQYQTFKLFAGVTKVGNAQGAHIIINDGFMSSEHAQIAMSPNGFTLIDNNSTNGTFVNERRVQRHELIDNDVIKFGKTDCKFKTINT
jgi:hypothetical protein